MKRIAQLLTIGTLAAATVTALAAPGSWTSKALMPMGVSGTAGCALDGIFYVIGGHERTNLNQVKTVFAYNPQTDTWSRKTDMPTARRWLAVTVLDGLIYALGGGGWREDPMATVEAYDPKTDAWMAKPRMPTARSFLAAATVDGILYAIGGGDAHSGSTIYYGTVEAYDSKTSQWTQKTGLPKPLALLTAVQVDGLIYAFEGSDSFVYDPKTDQWTAKASFSPAKKGIAAGAVDGKIYLVGGVSPDWWVCYDSVRTYDPVRDTFTARRKMPRTRLCAASAVIDGKIYIAGGASEEPLFVNPNAVFWTVLDVFDPEGGVTPQLLTATHETTNRLKLVWQAEAKCNYAVESSAALATNRWTRVTLPSGSVVTATNEIVETSISVSAADRERFFRVYEVE